MADVTLSDLIAWEPRLTIAPASGRAEAHLHELERWSEREVSWAVSARSTAPMLPLLRGGELVILPGRVLGDSGLSLPILLRELAAHDVAGVVIDSLSLTTSSLVPLLIAESLPPEFENDLNRLLTQRRGDLYRSGTDLGRLLSNLNASGATLDDILSAASTMLGVPAAVVDLRGGLLAATGNEAIPPSPAAGQRGWRGDRLAISLSSGETLWLGPVPHQQRALSRVAGERIALAAESAIVRAAQMRPRGPARVAALGALLGGKDIDAARTATSAGLAIDGLYRVAFADAGVDANAVQRLLAPLGTVHDAGHVDGMTAFIVETRSDGIPTFAPASLRAVFGFARDSDAMIGPAHGWLAISGVSRGAGQLPEHARQARFAAALLQHRHIPRPVARFDAVDDLGPFRLLYRLWGSHDLCQFSRDALGDLANHDRRGSLRETLLIFLECGGSHVEAARQLNIHRNTLAYRLKQIADHTHRDPADPGVRLTLHLALLGTMLPPAP